MEQREDDDIPSGIREDAIEEQPLGPTETDPDHDAPEAPPGIPTEGEPPNSG